MTFEEYWDKYGELHASMCNGSIKQFAKCFWESAQSELEETNRQLCRELDEAQRVVERLREGRTKNRWIPVSERLPEQGQLVLAWSKVFARQSDSGAMCARYDRDTFGDEIMDFHEVSHWQPIEEIRE